jgi:hypothetical protein
LPSFDASDLQVSVAWLPKSVVNVETVEILQGLRLAAGNKIERFGFSIPRNRVCTLKASLISDGIFPG